jgi:hypothetical protein
VTGFGPRIKRTPSPDFSSEGVVILSNLRCYFLQQPLLQHCLPLQQALVCALTGDAAKHAARLTIKRRYFIQFSCLSFPIILGYANDRVPTGYSGDHRARRRNGRTLKARCYAIVG